MHSANAKSDSRPRTSHIQVDAVIEMYSLAAAREHSTIPKAQVQAKDELERMKKDGTE